MNLTDALTNQHDQTAGITRRHGHAQAVVSDNHDPENLGRVKVKFQGLAQDAESDWAQIVSFMAGKDRGGVFMPEVGDTVLVAFDQGDLHHPYIIGGLWNSQDTSPQPNQDGQNNIRKIKSRSGHELIFGDDSQGGKEKVEIHTNSGHTILLDDSTGAEMIQIRDKTGSNVVTIDSVKGEMSLESQMTLKIKSAQIEIEAQTSLKITAGTTLEIQGAMVKIN